MAVWGSSALFSLPAQKIVYPDEWVYDAIAVLSREQRTVFFADSTLTIGQIERILTEIDEDALSPSGKIIYERVTGYLHSSPWLSYQSDALSVGVDVAVQPEGYFKTNPDVPWIYDHHSRNPIFLAPITLSFGRWITLEMDPFFGENEKAATLHHNYINVPLDMVTEGDLHFPKRAYLNAGIPFGKASGVNFALGIGEDFFGRTRTGSIILSDYLERSNYAQLSVFSPVVKYTAEIMQHEVNKYQYMHYLQVRPHRIVSISLTEGVMVNAPLELRFLNPMMIFHSYESYKTYTSYNEDIGADPVLTAPEDDSSRVGSFFGAKIELQPVKYLRLYGLFAMNQLQLGIEKKEWSDKLTPDALAFQAGTEVSIPVPRGYWLFGLEGVYTYPYMYVLHDKGWSFYKELAEVDNMKVRYWVGTPFGPDSIAGALWVGYHDSTQWSLEFSFLFAAQGERSGTDIFDDTSYPGYRSTPEAYGIVKPPTGTPTLTSTITLLGKWTPLAWLNLSLQPGYRIIGNSDHVSGKTEQGFEIVLAAQIKPSGFTIKRRPGR
jgi:hypothetical protein